MAMSKKYQYYEHYLLRGKLRKKGCERWRYVFTGINRETNDERVFFIELIIVNPAVSPSEPVIAQKSRPKLSEDDLQYALAGTPAATSVGAEEQVQPSYALVKAGCYGSGARFHNKFFASNELVWVKAERLFKLGSCLFSDGELRGSVIVGERELFLQPELMCSVGSIDWNLQFERKVQTPPMYKKKGAVWIANGVKTQFAGTVHMFGLEYTVSPKKSFGYIDRSWGANYAVPYFHVSSSNLVSSITGKPLLHSCFALSGEYDGQLRAYVRIEDEVLPIHSRLSFEKLSEVHNFLEMPPDADGEKLHWSVSIHKKRMVIDVDVFCKTSDMLVRSYELPEGGRTLLKILGGGNGFGEIRFYKKIGKTLELLEDARVTNAVCEFGTLEAPAE